MKKKPILWIIVAVVIAVVIGAAIWGRDYYMDRYVGSDYYTRVPLDHDMTPQPIYDMKGEPVGEEGVPLKLMACNENGESRLVEFTVRLDVDPLPEPGTYLRVAASEQIVVDWGMIEESDVPAAALQQINGN